MIENLELNPTHSTERVIKSLGSGFGAKVLLVEKGGKILTKKVFDPNLVAKVAYATAKLKPHPYSAEYSGDVVESAYLLRRVASRIARVISSEISIPDALELTDDRTGFYSEFIKGRPYKTSDFRVRGRLNEFERTLKQIGLPVWSFGSYLHEEKRKTNVLLDENNNIKIVDYEAGWPYLESEHLIGFDNVSILKFERFLKLAQPILQKKLGTDEYQNLSSSWNWYKEKNNWRQKENAPILKAQLLEEALEWRSLLHRGRQLYDSGVFTAQEWANLQKQISGHKEILRRISPHILIHILISIPLRFPLGSIARPVYTEIMGLIENTSQAFKKDKNIRIHNHRTAICAAIPFWIPPFNFFAYLSNVTGEGDLSFLIYDNVVYKLTGTGFREQFAKIRSKKVKNMVVTIFPENIRGRL